MLKKALEDRQDVELKICDCSEIPEWLNNKVAFLDFPTTVFIKDNIVRYTIVGTLSVSKIKSRIKDISFWSWEKGDSSNTISYFFLIVYSSRF